MQHFAIVIRPNGTVPFDKVDGQEHPHKAAILAHLHERGHTLQHHSLCNHHRGHACSCDPKIQGWSQGKEL